MPVCFLSDARRPTSLDTLSLHDALPISTPSVRCADEFWTMRAYRTSSCHSTPTGGCRAMCIRTPKPIDELPWRLRISYAADRKSTRLNSSHLGISYAVFCLKKKKKYTRE